MNNKSVCTVGYTESQLLTRSAVFFELTGVRRCAGFSCAADVPAGVYEYALLNFESDPCGGVVELAALCKRCRFVVLYDDVPLKPLYMQVFKKYGDVSLVFCPAAVELEECRGVLERKETFRSVAAKKWLSVQLPRSVRSMEQFTVQQLLSVFCMLKSMSMKETAAVLETTEKSARKTVEKIRKILGGEYATFEYLLLYSWLR